MLSLPLKPSLFFFLDEVSCLQHSSWLDFTCWRCPQIGLTSGNLCSTEIMTQEIQKHSLKIRLQVSFSCSKENCRGRIQSIKVLKGISRLAISLWYFLPGDSDNKILICIYSISLADAWPELLFGQGQDGVFLKKPASFWTTLIIYCIHSFIHSADNECWDLCQCCENKVFMQLDQVLLPLFFYLLTLLLPSGARENKVNFWSS
jgi:hypothetical protein